MAEGYRTMDYDAALAALVGWASGTEVVRAVVMTGSGAAGTAHPLSDRDVEIHTTDVDGLVADESWWRSLGDVLAVERLENDYGEPTRLVYYAGGKLDFTLVDAGSSPRSRAEPSVVLLDEDGTVSAGTEAPSAAGRPPSEAEFDESCQWAMAAALMCAKAIVRDEPWSAKVRDNDLKDELLRMIEWDHRARHGADVDTHFLGTRMATWMDADVRDDLTRCWGRFDAADSADALRHTVALIARLEQRVRDAYGFSARIDARVTSEIESILGSRDES